MAYIVFNTLKKYERIMDLKIQLINISLANMIVLLG